MKVEVYSAEWCKYCKEVKKFLTEKGISFEVKDIDGTEEDTPQDVLQTVKFMRRERHQTIPQVYIDGQHIGGCEDTKKYFGD